MKNRKMLDIMGLADEKYVLEADPKSKKRISMSKFKWTTFLSAAACLLLILNVAIIVPILMSKDETTPPGSDAPGNGNIVIQNPSSKDDPSDKEDEYTPDMQFLKNPALLGAIDAYYKNGGSLEKVEGTLENESDSMQDASQEEISDQLKDFITDINDNQVDGISEGDIAKRSDKYLYYLNGTTLYVYSINGGASKAECVLPLDGYVEKMNSISNSLAEGLEEIEKIDGTEPFEMYLSKDFKTLTIIIKSEEYYGNDMTGIVTIDVSASPTIEFKDFKVFSGEYITSRVVDDEILLFTKYYAPKKYDTEHPETYIPFYLIDKFEDFRYSDAIYFPPKLSSSTYITVSRIDQKKLRVQESVSYLSYSEDIYVSQENIFLTRPISVAESVGFAPIDTEIAVIGYKSDLFQNKGSVTVKGYVKDQYSLDEYEGILRVATTSYIKESDRYVSTASLFCIDIEKMEIEASVECFAPKSEIVRSVRFDGTNGYICTSYQEVLIDPVFFFDLSDLSNITYTETGEIDGYSSSLINIGGGYVIGIGYGDNTSTLKIEAYKQNGDSVVPVCYEVFAKTKFSTNYKSYLVDRENHLLGLAVSTYAAETGAYEDSYLLLHFNGEFFDKMVAVEISHKNTGSARAFYEDKFLYVVTDSDFNAYGVGSLRDLPFTSADGTTSGVQGGTDQTPNGPAWPSN